jgi:hypothetical protein
MRIRLAAVLAVLALSSVGRVPAVQAAAETHRLNVVLSGTPTQVRADDFNGFIDDLNQRFLTPQGLEPLGKIRMSWLFDGEVRYFARQNLAVSVGVGRLHSSKRQEYLPAIGRSIVLTAEVTSVPIHAGAAYYLKPYNQGDFQARAYVGAGFVSLVANKATFRQDQTGTPAPTIRISGTNDGPGFYTEAGAHMFFATRFSVMLGALYRSNNVRNLVDEGTGLPFLNFDGQPISLDVGGIGFKMALGIGL